MRQRRYSEHTIKSYRECLRVFITFDTSKTLSEITLLDLERFNEEYIIRNGFSPSYQNQVINALKLYFRKFHSKHFDLTMIERPREGVKLPLVLSLEEVQHLLRVTRNVKHKTMLMLIYSSGLRRSELLNLKIEHIESERMLIRIRNAKGNKDRMVPLSQKMLDQLRMYYRMYKPKIHLFEGVDGDSYSATSLQQVLRQSLNKAGIRKRVTLHTLRHSYATHMLEFGVNLRYIQEILGHRSSKTTEIYTHVQSTDYRKLVNPMDKLNI
jgi:integrase/recombinase XerD